MGLSSPAVYLTVAEYFREDLQQDVLLFIDNIFRFGRSGTSPGHISGEVQSTCQLGRIPGDVSTGLFGQGSIHGSLVSVFFRDLLSGIDKDAFMLFPA